MSVALLLTVTLQPQPPTRSHSIEASVQRSPVRDAALRLPAAPGVAPDAETVLVPPAPDSEPPAEPQAQPEPEPRDQPSSPPVHAPSPEPTQPARVQTSSARSDAWWDAIAQCESGNTNGWRTGYYGLEAGYPIGHMSKGDQLAWAKDIYARAGDDAWGCAPVAWGMVPSG